MPSDLVTTNIIREIIEELSEVSPNDEQELEFLSHLNRIKDTKAGLDFIHGIIRSQSKRIRLALEEEDDVSVFGIGQFHIKAHDRVIFELMCEVAKEKGYDNLRDITSPEIWRGIRNEVDIKRKPILQDNYRKRREIRPNNNPAVLRVDFRQFKSNK